MITLTIDLEDPTDRYEADGRYVLMTERILGLCRDYRRRATFFTVGRIAEAAPALVKAIADQGHEIAYHSHAHVPLTKETPERFRRESREDKNRLEQLTGKSVTGYRAPRFSLTPESVWAVDILGELGFQYSSSIMPTPVSLFGFPGASHLPFRWPNGLLELPLPVAKLGPWSLPFLGGIYLYAMPFALTRRWIERAAPGEILWTYTHPYDFDREQGFARMAGTPLWATAILKAGRHVAEAKIRKLMMMGSAAPLNERGSALGLKN